MISFFCPTRLNLSYFLANPELKQSHRQTVKTQNGGEGVKKPVFSVRIENEILSKIDRIASEEDRSRGAVIRRIIRQFFQVGGAEPRSDDNGNSKKEQA